jgi:hypothetical protein
VKADILGGTERTVGEAVDHDALVEQADGNGSVRDFVGRRDRIPERSERPPVGFGEGESRGRAETPVASEARSSEVGTKDVEAAMNH